MQYVFTIYILRHNQVTLPKLKKSNFQFRQIYLYQKKKLYLFVRLPGLCDMAQEKYQFELISNPR